MIISSLKRWVLIGGFTTLTACTTSNNTLSENDIDIVKTTAQWQALTNSNKAKIEWIEALEDPILESLIIKAQKNNQDLKTIASSVATAKVFSDKARAALLLEINTTPSIKSIEDVKEDSQTDKRFKLESSWESDLWRRAQKNSKTNKHDLLFAQYALAANVARAYFIAIEAEQQLSIVRQTVTSLRAMNRIINIQYSKSAATKQDTVLAKTHLLNTEEALSATKVAKKNAIKALDILLASPSSIDLKIDANLPNIPEQISMLSSETLEYRPDLYAANRHIAMTFNQLDTTKAAKLPYFSLTGSLGGTSSSLRSISSPTNTSWQWRSNLLAPLLSKDKQVEMQIKTLTEEQEASISTYTLLALDAFNEVETALDWQVMLKENRLNLEYSLKTAKKALCIANLRFQQGEINLLEVLTTQQRVFQTKRNQLSIHRTQLDQYTSLNLALGIPITDKYQL